MDKSILALKLGARGFQVVAPLKGAGHAAGVFHVRDCNDESYPSYVAKVVTLSGLDAKSCASAQQEVSLLKGLASHPNLIAYRESFMEDASLLFIIMSLAEDGDLRHVVTDMQAAKRRIPEPVCLTWARQVLSGLDFLHGKDVVHRDLKSSNIFLCEGKRRIRIGDFGISRVLESTSLATSCVGTPAYMSPELMRNERYAHHVDMWALGCICYELCTLSLPFTAKSLLELACQIMEGDPTWSSWDGYSEEFREVTARLLTKDMAARPNAAMLLAEPLFAAWGRASQSPPEEDWAVVVSATPSEAGKSPEKKGSPQTPPSQLTTKAGTEEDGSSLGASADLSERSIETIQAANSFQRQLQRARDQHHQFSKEEFAELLSTHHELRLKELQACGGSGGPAAGAQQANVIQEPLVGVLETLV